MRQVSSLFTNYNGTFPNYSGKNATGAGATDGTEWIAGYIDDYGWGWAQALMEHENLTPDGVTEAAGASQILDAIQLLFPHWQGLLMQCEFLLYSSAIIK